MLSPKKLKEKISKIKPILTPSHSADGSPSNIKTKIKYTKTIFKFASAPKRLGRKEICREEMRRTKIILIITLGYIIHNTYF
jgi:hypothetical protein